MANVPIPISGVGTAVARAALDSHFWSVHSLQLDRVGCWIPGASEVMMLQNGISYEHNFVRWPLHLPPISFRD